MGKNFTKKLLPLALTAAMIVPSVPAMAAPSDIAGHWAESVITQWQSKGLIQGYEDGTFKPGNTITRAEFVTLMNNAKGFWSEGSINFSDVKNGSWFYSAVARAVAAGYVKGYSDGSFKPGNTITRAEAAVMIANAARLSANEAGAYRFNGYRLHSRMGAGQRGRSRCGWLYDGLSRRQLWRQRLHQQSRGGILAQPHAERHGVPADTAYHTHHRQHKQHQ